MQPRLLFASRLGIAAVWIGFGLLAKVLDGVPRHRAIVARVVGEARATHVTLLVGAIEILLGIWILTGRRPRMCAATQTALLAGMNTLELLRAPDLLLAPRAMIAANVVLITAGWALALGSPRKG